jgi:hypothetical protein
MVVKKSLFVLFFSSWLRKNIEKSSSFDGKEKNMSLTLI